MGIAPHISVALSRGEAVCRPFQGDSYAEGTTYAVDAVLLRQSPCAGGTRKREYVSRQAPTRRAFASKRKQQESFLLPLFRQRLGQRVYTQSAPTQEEPSNLGGIIFSESSHAALFLVGHTMSSISTLLNELLYQRR